MKLPRKHPWAEATHWDRSLEDLRGPDTLKQFDLIVVAIGSPNVERFFAEHCTERSDRRAGDHLLAGRLRDRRPCDPG